MNARTDFLWQIKYSNIPSSFYRFAWINAKMVLNNTKNIFKTSLNQGVKYYKENNIM
jgi:hypothetical protein